MIRDIWRRTRPPAAAVNPGFTRGGRGSSNDRRRDAYGGPGRESRGELQRGLGVREGPRALGRSVGGFRGRGPRGYRRSDERIREDACECLTYDDRIDASNVEVTVQDGEVTLSGGVNSRIEKRRAADLLERLPGVTDVLNNLRVINEGGLIEGPGDPGRERIPGRHPSS